MILQGHLNERKGSVVLKCQLCFWANVTAEVPLVQSLIQCSFSSALMIYQKVSLDGTNSPLREEWGPKKLAKKGGGG